MGQEPPSREQQLQTLDVHLVDVLANLEALLRYSHWIQRALLQLRSEAPPPQPQMPEHGTAVLTGHIREMRREWGMLGELISDLTIGVRRLNGEQDSADRRCGMDRRRIETVGA